MIAVIFEATPAPGRRQECLDLAEAPADGRKAHED